MKAFTHPLIAVFISALIFGAMPLPQTPGAVEAFKTLSDVVGLGIPVVTGLALLWAWLLWRKYTATVAEYTTYLKARVQELESRSIGNLAYQSMKTAEAERSAFTPSAAKSG